VSLIKLIVAAMLIIWIFLVLSSIYNTALIFLKLIIIAVKKIFKLTPVFEEGYQYIILKDTELTKHPDKFSEGVFAWYENNTLSCSEEYQIENGGDPVVLKKFLLKTGTKKINL